VSYTKTPAQQKVTKDAKAITDMMIHGMRGPTMNKKEFKNYNTPAYTEATYACVRVPNAAAE
jgi:hypothetical protein